MRSVGERSSGAVYHAVMDLAFAILISVVLALVLVLLLRIVFASGKSAEARAEATRLGLSPETITRLVAGQQRHAEWEFLNAKMTRYTASALMNDRAVKWALLIRPHASLEGFPEHYEIEGIESLPEELVDDLRFIANDFADGEFLEIESDGSGLSAYWEEWGGTTGAQRIAGYLERIVRHDPNVAKAGPSLL